MSASWALQQAVFATLANDGGMQDAFGDPPRVYDTPPRGAGFPYCVIGADLESDDSTATEKGSAHVLSVEVWSRASGFKEAKDGAEAVRDALDGASLTVTGQTLIDLRWLDATTQRESDGETVRATLRFRAVLESQT